MRSPQTVSLVYVLRLHSSSKGHFYAQSQAVLAYSPTR